MCHWQLPGRLGGDDARRDQAGAVWPNHHCRLAIVLLGGRARQISDALQRRSARRQLAHRTHQRLGRWQVRRRLACSEFRESQNPANTLWTKQYNVYSKIDTEAARYLGFERWWGGHVNLNAEEIQFIVDELFVGNNLAAGRIKTSDGTAIDLRNIRSPIVVFCSKGDNVTPPQQALGWILDLYDECRRDPLVWADHRLHRSRTRRTPWNLRVSGTSRARNTANFPAIST